MELSRARAGAQRVRFVVERKLVWRRQRLHFDGPPYTGHFLSEPTITGEGRTLAELRRNLVDAWRRRHGALVPPTGRPARGRARP